MKIQNASAIALAVILTVLIAGARADGEVKSVNPASEFCVQQGGLLSIETDRNGGQTGMCTFVGQRQCEEWAMFRGDCPIGGLIIDPFAYCREVSESEIVPLTDTGDEFPGALLPAMLKQGIISQEMPVFMQRAEWRCLSGEVWVCAVGANRPCAEKADTSKTASSAMHEFCQHNPDANVIPAVVTGRATVYSWHCEGDSVRIRKQVFTTDGQGFLAEFWTRLIQ